MRKKRRASWPGRLIQLLIVAAAAWVFFAATTPEDAPWFEAPDRNVDWATLARAPAAGDFRDTRVELGNGEQVSESQIQSLVDQLPAHKRWYAQGWHAGDLPVTTVAPGTDRKHHFVNAFLVGFVPMRDVPPWVPLYVIAKRKKYLLDKTQYGVEEMWQTSREAMSTLHGDCEDHAIALADWLIGLGKDARVVLGRARGEGHAWVVVVDRDTTWLLEATDKRRLRRWSYPVASLHSDYVPKEMFNRQHWWRNTGGATVDYVGPHWQRASTVVSAPGQRGT